MRLNGKELCRRRHAGRLVTTLEATDAIVNGVHGYMPDNYVVPKEPEVRARLEWFKNQIVELVRDYGPIDVIWLDGER